MATCAIVARSTENGLAYLKKRYPRADWGFEAYEAETFIDMRDATRAALVLPSQLRAFALPLTRAI